MPSEPKDIWFMNTNEATDAQRAIDDAASLERVRSVAEGIRRVLAGTNWTAWTHHLVKCAECAANDPCAEGLAILGTLPPRTSPTCGATWTDGQSCSAPRTSGQSAHHCCLTAGHTGAHVCNEGCDAISLVNTIPPGPPAVPRPRGWRNDVA